MGVIVSRLAGSSHLRYLGLERCLSRGLDRPRQDYDVRPAADVTFLVKSALIRLATSSSCSRAYLREALTPHLTAFMKPCRSGCLRSRARRSRQLLYGSLFLSSVAFRFGISTPPA